MKLIVEAGEKEGTVRRQFDPIEYPAQCFESPSSGQRPAEERFDQMKHAVRSSALLSESSAAGSSAFCLEECEIILTLPASSEILQPPRRFVRCHAEEVETKRRAHIEPGIGQT